MRGSWTPCSASTRATICERPGGRNCCRFGAKPCSRRRAPADDVARAGAPAGGGAPAVPAAAGRPPASGERSLIPCRTCSLRRCLDRPEQNPRVLHFLPGRTAPFHVHLGIGVRLVRRRVVVPGGGDDLRPLRDL